jgi:3-(3-hydroxy-phenyl)propionate hydroxylase
MPPFAGEGMCAGLRDIENLIWRLDLVLSGVSGVDLLDEWASERREGAKWYINFSAELGRVICVTDPDDVRARDERMKAEYARQSQVGPVSPHRALLGAGTWVGDDPLAGQPSVQGRVAYQGRTGRFDNTVGLGWFLLSAPGADGTLTSAERSRLEAAGGHALVVGPRGSGADVIDLERVYTDWMAVNEVSHLFVRPDFYVAATARDGDELRVRFEEVMDTVIPIT